MAKQAKKKEAPKSAPTKAEKIEKKAGKSAKASKAELAAAPADAPPVDQDELDEQEDAAAASSSGGGGNAAALAAASSGTEMSASFKNFRHHPDMENFYRFIFDNDLRHEALVIIDEIQAQKANRKALMKAKTNAH